MDDRSYQNAIAYLLLRVEKLKNFSKIKYKKLDALYERYQSDGLTDCDFTFLHRLIDSKLFPEYSLKNLQAIYACEFWINEFLKSNQDKDLSYVESLKNYQIVFAQHYSSSPSVIRPVCLSSIASSSNVGRMAFSRRLMASIIQLIMAGQSSLFAPSNACE